MSIPIHSNSRKATVSSELTAVLLLSLLLQSFFGLPAERPLTPSNDQTSQGQGSQMEEGAAANNNTSKEAARLWALPSGLSEQQVG
jgi:hypothetical protein